MFVLYGVWAMLACSGSLENGRAIIFGNDGGTGTLGPMERAWRVRSIIFDLGIQCVEYLDWPLASVVSSPVRDPG